jgi:hypothetical protein
MKKRNKSRTGQNNTVVVTETMHGGIVYAGITD